MYVIVNLSNVYKMHDNTSLFMQVRVRTDGRHLEIEKPTS